MTVIPTEKLDCRGLQCPAPILKTARAAKRISHKGILEISADDPAFPLDIQSWCHSSQSQLLDINQQGDHFIAHVLIDRSPAPPPAAALTSAVTPPAAAPQPAPSSPPTTPPAQTLDCRGLQCPAPILKVARAARTIHNATLAVIADDPAFPLDIQSWCQSAHATLTSIDPYDGAFRALIFIGSDTAEDHTSELSSAPTLSARRASVVPDSLTNRAPSILLPPTDPLSPELLSRYLNGFPFAEQVTFCSLNPTLITVIVPWCATHGHQLLNFDTRTQPPSALIQLKPAPALTPTPTPVITPTHSPSTTPAPKPAERSCALLVLHSDHEALLAAMLVANGAIAQGMKVTIFFTFWGLNLLRGDSIDAEIAQSKKSWLSRLFSSPPTSPHRVRSSSTALTLARPSFIQRVFKWMMPKGPRQQSLGQLNFGGVGRGLLNNIMQNQNIMSLPELMASAIENDARFIACTMSMSVMGITADEFMDIPSLQLGGVASFVEAAERAEFSMMF